MLSLKLSGDEDLLRHIAKLPQKIQKGSALAALVESVQPVVRVMRANAPAKSGALKKSIGVRFRRYRGGKQLLAVVGPRRGVWGPAGEKPSKYAHLVEYGWTTKSGKRITTTADGFMRRAWMSAGGIVLKLFKDRFSDRLRVEVENRQAKKK